MTAGCEMAGKPQTRTQARTSESAPVVMLIHGMWSRPHVWDGFRAFFEDRGYRVIIPTLRHHDMEPGGIPHPELADASLAHYAADIAREIGKLGCKPLVIGHSMGGTLAQMLAARGLVRAAVGLAPAQIAGTMNLDLRSMWIFRREFTSWGFWRQPHLPSFEAMRYGILNGMPESEAEQLYEKLIPESGRALLEIGWWFIDGQRTTWINPQDVCCPMLFLTGEKDLLTPLRVTHRIAEFYEGRVPVEGLPQRGHWLPAEPGWEALAARAATFFETEAPEMARRMAIRSATLAPALVNA
ncbi:alpha/beta hydrolase [Parvibaculum sp.]|jgi:non-heme chloroperoxidase|uniref:alpha/beta hydrolase n=1 Tax=Parvibaculum sp. TaxID=2024848 RepID=UPI0025F8A80D|nr:alpha/beta hydrolase [Parvibaculum sp.]